MDVSAINLAPGAALSDESPFAVPGAGVGGDVFAKLIGDLGAAPTQADAGAGAAVPLTAPLAGDASGATAADPAMLLTGHPTAAPDGKPQKPVRAGKAEAGDVPAPSRAPADDKATAEPAPLTPETLGLPPLLAALISPTLVEAAPVSATAPAVTTSAGPSPRPASPGSMAPISATVISSGDAGALPGGALLARVGPAAESAAPVAAPAALSAVPVADTPAAVRGGEGSPEPAALPAAPVAAAAQALAPAMRQATAAEAKVPPIVASSVARSEPVDAPVREAPAAETQVALGAPTAAIRRPAAPALPRAERGAPSVSMDPPSPAVAVAAGAAPLPLPLAAPHVDIPLTTAAAIAGNGPAQGAAPAEQAIERQLDIARDGAWLDQLASDIVRTAGTEGSLRFKLNPETLGSLHVEIAHRHDGASVRLTADTEQARALIADARPQLVAEARAHGVRIAEAHVDLSGQGQSQLQSQAGNGGRDGRELPTREYLTSWKAESAEEEATPARRATAERYA